MIFNVFFRCPRILPRTLPKQPCLSVIDIGKPYRPRESRDDDDDKVVFGNRTLAILMKPQIVMLRVSMHCNGCAKKVEKHVSKIEGVSCYKVGLESKMVVIIGDVVPVEVLESVFQGQEG